MSASPAELSMLAIADMVREIRTANGWQSEAGADVRLSPWFVEMADAQQTQTCIYELSDLQVDGKDLDGTARTNRMEQIISVEVYARPIFGREAQQYAQIKADLKRCIQKPIGARLNYGGSEIGSVFYRGTTLNEDARALGLIGATARVVVKYTETVQH